MQPHANPSFNAQRGVSFLPRDPNANGIKAYQNEQYKIDKAREDEFLSSGERLQKIKRHDR